MANHTKIVRGKYWDGCSEADTTTVAKKINDVLNTGGATLVSITLTKSGRDLVACIVYTTA